MWTAWLEALPLVMEVGLKSNASDQYEMVQAIYRDACAKCIADVSDLRDLMTIKSRIEEEGISFLTITLPNFSRDFERSLADGFIDSTRFRNFRKRGSIPAFLQGMISQLFDRETGRIFYEKDNEYSVIVEGIRQICLAFKKIELECSSERTNTAFVNFKEIERSFNVLQLPDQDASEFKLVSDCLWNDLMGLLQPFEMVPRHGPGATAEHISSNKKYAWKFWYDRLEPYFPFFGNAYSVSAFDSREFEQVTIVPVGSESPVRVTPVPKTLKGPRIIAIEPVCMQYVQQAIRRALYASIESSEILGSHVNFRDQSINQNLALISSKDGRLATIDLSDASDRVPRNLALQMFDGNPDLRDAIDACRSTSAIMPDGEIISPLGKFASMGSALCFPVESMYFYTVCVAALLRSMDLPVTRANCLKVGNEVHVYGDDIIVPSTYASTVLDYLQKYNCKINYSKTFVSGNFRESCGLDAFNGEPVTPVYIRRKHPRDRLHVQELISWVASANLFYLKGYWQTASYMFRTCEKILGPLPYVSGDSSALGRISFQGWRSAGRWNSVLHRFEIKAWVPSPVYRSDKVEGYAALQKCLLRLEELNHPTQNNNTPLDVRLVRLSKLDIQFAQDERHLERSARRGAVAIKRRWVPAL